MTLKVLLPWEKVKNGYRRDRASKSGGVLYGYPFFDKQGLSTLLMWWDLDTGSCIHLEDSLKPGAIKTAAEARATIDAALRKTGVYLL